MYQIRLPLAICVPHSYCHIFARRGYKNRKLAPITLSTVPYLRAGVVLIEIVDLVQPYAPISGKGQSYPPSDHATSWIAPSQEPALRKLDVPAGVHPTAMRSSRLQAVLPELPVFVRDRKFRNETVKFRYIEGSGPSHHSQHTVFADSLCRLVRALFLASFSAATGTGSEENHMQILRPFRKGGSKTAQGDDVDSAETVQTVGISYRELPQRG